MARRLDKVFKDKSSMILGHQEKRARVKGSILIFKKMVR